MSEKQQSQGISGRDSDFLYDSLAEILSANRPIEGVEEAFNCASTLSNVLHFIGKVVGTMDLTERDRSAISEIVKALDLISRRLAEWESRAIGLGAIDSADVKFVQERSNKKK